MVPGVQTTTTYGTPGMMPGTYAPMGPMGMGGVQQTTTISTPGMMPGYPAPVIGVDPGYGMYPAYPATNVYMGGVGYPHHHHYKYKHHHHLHTPFGHVKFKY